MGGSALYLGALVAYPLSPHGREVWNRQGQVTLRVANPVVVSTHKEDSYDEEDGQIALVWDQEHGEVVEVDSQPITGVTVAAGGPPPTR